MSLVLQGASNRTHHTNAILGSVGIAFSGVSSHQRERREQQQRGSQETLTNAGTTAVYKMISPAADILTRLGVDHVIIGLLCILLQLLLDWINYFWPVYSCDVVGPHLAHSNAGIIFGIFYMFLGIISVKIGSFSRNSSGDEARRRFTTFHILNFINFLASSAFLLASGLLLYILWLRLGNLHRCHCVDWSFLQVLNFMVSDTNETGATTSNLTGTTSSYATPAVIPTFTAESLAQTLSATSSAWCTQQSEKYNEYELHAAIICASIINGFHGLIGTLELLMTFVGCCLRTS